MTYANITNAKISEFTGNIHQYYDSYGFTKKCGVPIDYMIQINNVNRWYRVKVYQVSNTGTAFIKTKDNPFLIVDIHKTENHVHFFFTNDDGVNGVFLLERGN